MEKYKSIIDLPYKKSSSRKHMSLNDRAAQFAPFSALTGYEESIKETSRRTTEKKRLSQEAKDIISAKLNFIVTNNLKENIKVVYFVKDDKKQGGKYLTIFIEIKRVDEVNKVIHFIDNQIISINDIIEVNSNTIDSIFIDF